MKYLRFDYEGLLKDYESNKALAKSLKKQIAYLEDGTGVKHGDLNYMDIVSNPDTLTELHKRWEEADFYVRLVDESFSSLRERERETLRKFYIEGKTAEVCADELFCSVRDFFRVKAVAFDQFKHIIYWR